MTRVVSAPFLPLALAACASTATSPEGDRAGGAAGAAANAGTAPSAGMSASAGSEGLGGGAAGGAPHGGAWTAGAARAGSDGSGGAASGGGAGSSRGGVSSAGASGASGPSGSGGMSGTAGASAGTSGSGGGGAATTGGSGGGGAAACAFAFCEDFESGSFDAPRWTVATTGANTAFVTREHAAHGTYSALFHYAGVRGTWAFAHTALAPNLATHHFGRVNVLLTPRLPARHTIFVTAGTAGFPLDRYLEVAGNGTAFQLTAVDLPNDRESYKIGGSLPAGSWFCMEWEFSDVPDRSTVSVNGAEALAASFSIAGTSSGIVGAFSVLGIGLRAWGTESGDNFYDLFYDDLAIDSARVGCSP